MEYLSNTYYVQPLAQWLAKQTWFCPPRTYSPVRKMNGVQIITVMNVGLQTEARTLQSSTSCVKC